MGPARAGRRVALQRGRVPRGPAAAIARRDPPLPRRAEPRVRGDDVDPERVHARPAPARDVLRARARRIARASARAADRREPPPERHARPAGAGRPRHRPRPAAHRRRRRRAGAPRFAAARLPDRRDRVADVDVDEHGQRDVRRQRRRGVLRRARPPRHRCRRHGGGEPAEPPRSERPSAYALRRRAPRRGAARHAGIRLRRRERGPARGKREAPDRARGGADGGRRAHERAALRRAADGEPHPVRVRVDDLARAPHAAERDARLSRDGPRSRPVARGEAASPRSVAAERLRELLELIESTLEIGRIDAGRDEVRWENVHFDVFWRELGRDCTASPRSPSRWRSNGSPTRAA